MSEGFDPYLQWLGIRDPQRPPNHYRLLGLELFESDPDVISNAADRQMAHVRTFHTGRHAADSQRILNELAAAKVCLLNPNKKSAYDAQLRAELAAAASAAGAEPVQADRTVTADTRRAVLWLAISGLVAGLVVLAVVGSVSLGLFGLGPQGRQQAERAAPSEAPTPAEAKPSPVSRESASESVQGRPSEPGTPTGGTVPPKPAGTAKPVPPPPPPVGPPSPTAPPQLPSSSPAKVPGQGSEMPGRGPQPGPQPQSKVVVEPKVSAEPLPPVSQSIEAVRAAMKRRDLAAAKRHFELAEKAAQASPYPKDQHELDRLRDVFVPWLAFWDAVQKAMQGAKVGETLQAGVQTAEIVRAEPERLGLRIAGAERFYGLQDLPAPLALALAERSLPAGPILDFAKIAFFVVDPQGDVDRAVELWNKTAGPDRSPSGLVAEIKQALAARPVPPQPKPQAPAPSSRSAVPDPSAQQAARTEVREFYKARFLQARTPAEKGLLANELLRKAADTKDDPVVRYVLLAEACEVALAAGEVKVLRDSIQEMAKHYQVDPLEEQARVYSEAVEMAMPSAQRNSLARAALTAAQEAVQVDAYSPAARLAKAAFAMANKVISTKGRDLPTIRQASELSELIPWYQQQHELAQQAEKTLAAEPGNAEACLFLGKYYALVKGNWSRAWPLLLKVEQPPWRSLAEGELAVQRSGGAAEMAKLADLWRQSLPAIEEPWRRFARRRALYWYQTALPRVRGYTQERVVQAIEELGAMDSGRRKP